MEAALDIIDKKEEPLEEEDSSPSHHTNGSSSQVVQKLAELNLASKADISEVCKKSRFSL
jgi:hypothetical protein